MFIRLFIFGLLTFLVCCKECNKLFVSFNDINELKQENQSISIIENGQLSPEWLSKTSREVMLAESGLSIFRISSPSSIQNLNVQTSAKNLLLSYKLSPSHSIHGTPDLQGADLEILYQNCNSPGRVDITVSFSLPECPAVSFQWGVVCTIIQSFTKIPPQLAISTSETGEPTILKNGVIADNYINLSDASLTDKKQFTFYIWCISCIVPMLFPEPLLISDNDIVFSTLSNNPDELFGLQSVLVRNKKWSYIGETPKKVTINFTCKSIGTSPVGIHLITPNHHNLTFAVHKKCDAVDKNIDINNAKKMQSLSTTNNMKMNDNKVLNLFSSLFFTSIKICLISATIIFIVLLLVSTEKGRHFINSISTMLNPQTLKDIINRLSSKKEKQYQGVNKHNKFDDEFEDFGAITFGSSQNKFHYEEF